MAAVSGLVAPASPFARAAWLAAYALVTFLSFPHPVAGRVIDLGLVAGWIAPALLLVGLDGVRAGRAASWGFAAGLVAHALVLHWLYVVTVSYGHAPALVGVLAPFALGAYCALFVGLFAAVWGWLQERSLASPLAAAALWTAVEHGRTWVFTGFPWAMLGYSQHENPALLGLAAWTGVSGLSFTVFLGGASLACAVRSLAAGRGVGRPAAAGVAGVLALHGLGLAVRTPEDPPEAPTVRMAALQGNIDQGVKWSRAWRDRTLGIYEALTRDAAAQGARVILWPETALPGALEADARLADRIARLARETRATLVVGGVGVTVEAGRIREYFDSAFVVDPSGAVRHRYDKTHLVPFGEFVPFRDLLGRVFRAVASGMTTGDVTPGPEPRSLVLAGEGGPGGERGVRLGVPICYELIFPDLVRRFGRDGAGVLLGITNDAWYGKTGAPFQFFAITALRSAESGLWTVRAANTGVSGIIDARGAVREQTWIFERDAVVADVPILSTAGGRTVYARHGDWVVWACWLGIAGLAVVGTVRRGRAAATKAEERS